MLIQSFSDKKSSTSEDSSLGEDYEIDPDEHVQLVFPTKDSQYGQESEK